MSIQNGNALLAGQNHGHWFVGDFKKWKGLEGLGLRQSSVVEVKYHHIPAGTCRTDDAACGKTWAGFSDKITLCIVVVGQVIVEFRGAENTHRVLGANDYAVWGRDVEHTWTCPEGAIVITVRWDEP